MRAFVTGGTGFVGANLVAGLNERGITARVFRRHSSSLKALEGLIYETAVGDILDPVEKLAETMEGCDWVFHAAAAADYWRKGREHLYEINVQGTEHVLEAALLAGVNRLVFTSSIAAMGLSAKDQLLDESCVFNLAPAHFPYGHSKHLAEEKVLEAVEEGLEAVIVNPTVVLGPRDVNLVSGVIVIEAANGNGLARFYPPGGVNYVAVEDVVAGHIAAAEHGRIGERYILAGENVRHKDMMDIVCAVVGRPGPSIPVPSWVFPPAARAVSAARTVLGIRKPPDGTQVRMFGRTVFVDNSKAVSELASPQIPFRIAVQNTYDWYNSNGFLG